MSRFASAFAFLFVLSVVLVSAGCGHRFDELVGGSPPGQASFAADGLAALEEAGSAHVVLDAQAGAISGTRAEVGVHFEGDVSTSALVGDLQVSFPGGTLGARVLADKQDVYVRFMGAWYHEDAGVADAFDMAGETNGELLSQLTTPSELGKLFTQLFDGEIAQGPDMAGASTWEFDGRLRAGTFANLVAKYGGIELSANDRAQFDKVVATSHLVVDVGQEDALPKKLEFTLDPPKDLQFDSKDLESSDDVFSVTIELSDFGERVSFSRPTSAKPLDELFGQLFGAMG